MSTSPQFESVATKEQKVRVLKKYFDSLPNLTDEEKQKMFIAALKKENLTEIYLNINNI